MGENAARQPQQPCGELAQQIAAVGQQRSDVVLQQGTDSFGSAGCQIQQPGLHQRQPCAGGGFQIRQDSREIFQLPQGKRAQHEQQHGQKAEGHADTDGGAYHPGHMQLPAQKPHHWLRRQSQQGAQQEGGQQRKKVFHGQPCEYKHCQCGKYGFAGKTHA